MAQSQAGLERLQIGINRLLSVLDREEVAGIRTLEMKISDAGPQEQRVEPHILGIAGQELVSRGRVSIYKDPRTSEHNWYYPSRFGIEQIREKISEIVPAYLATTNAAFTSSLGDPLEISIFKILQQLKKNDRRFTFLGAFDLDQRGNNGRYDKSEPSIFLNDGILHGPADFVIFEPHCGEPALIECKNYREWIYPSSEVMKALIQKAIKADMTPVLIARRLPFITKRILCEPAGIIAHETYHQLYPETEEGQELAALVSKKRGLGYADVRASEEPLPRTINFFERNLPQLLPDAARKFQANRQLLSNWAEGAISWHTLRTELGVQYTGPDSEMNF